MSVNLDASSAQGISAGVLNDEIFLTDIRKQLFKFALLHFFDAGIAEDDVKEALIGALRDVASLSSRAQDLGVRHSKKMRGMRSGFLLWSVLC